MATTVNDAFAEFLRNTVNLDPEVTKKARNSRDWLIGNIGKFDGSVDDFPELYTEMHIEFGSFSRRTKKRPLDDIDLMIALKGQGGKYEDKGDRIEIYMPDTAYGLSGLREENNRLNSRKVINTFVSALKGVENYKNAEIKRNQEAATLNLTSYDWVYDIVPCFFTTPEFDGRTYYIIPDGNGNWKKTDPRIDTKRANTINAGHKNAVLQVIRLVKYWNARPTMPSMSSYLLENMILNYYSTLSEKDQYWADIEFRDILYYIDANIFNNVLDPKNIQGNINTLSWDEKEAIQKRAKQDYAKANEAVNLEVRDSDHKASIAKWIEIFGSDFPVYTGS